MNDNQFLIEEDTRPPLEADGPSAALAERVSRYIIGLHRPFWKGIGVTTEDRIRSMANDYRHYAGRRDLLVAWRKRSGSLVMHEIKSHARLARSKSSLHVSAVVACMAADDAPSEQEISRWSWLKKRLANSYIVLDEYLIACEEGIYSCRQGRWVEHVDPTVCNSIAAVADGAGQTQLSSICVVSGHKGLFVPDDFQASKFNIH